MDDNKINGFEDNTENGEKNIEETGVFSTVESLREKEDKAEEPGYPTGKKVLDFFKGFFGIAAILIISFILVISAKNSTIAIGILLFGLIFIIIAITAGLIIMKYKNIRFIGIGILVASIMPFIVLFIATGGCGLFHW